MWGRGRRRAAAAAILVLIVQGCASVGGSGCADAPDAVAREAPGGSLSLVSWNVHGLPFDASFERRLGSIAAEIQRRRPDVVLLQEAWLESDAGRFACALRAHYERVPEAEGVRAGLLAPFGHRRGGLLALVRRDSAWRLEPAKPTFEEFAAGAPWYRLDELDGIAGKGVQSFALGDGTRRIAVVNTHLQAQYPARGNRYEAERLSQIEQLVAHARKASGADVLLVAGDLNTLEDEKAHFGAIAAELDDLTAPLRASCGGCGTFISREGTEAWWIDYVLARPAPGQRIRAEVERIRNRGRDEPYSDHHGLWLQMNLLP
jgi:endonuclease/exonuclease/phosphatase family metal-dependent hydrolase